MYQKARITALEVIVSEFIGTLRDSICQADDIRKTQENYVTYVTRQREKEASGEKRMDP